ncbi:hypothetical protein ACP70R_015973 [Stipagrostis hirtigluma subsp. patula]
MVIHHDANRAIIHRCRGVSACPMAPPGVPRSDRMVRRTAMVGAATAAFFLLTADYGPNYPNPHDGDKEGHGIIRAILSIRQECASA